MDKNNKPEVEQDLFSRILHYRGGPFPLGTKVETEQQSDSTNNQQQKDNKKPIIETTNITKSNNISLWNIIRYTLATILILFLLIMAYNHNKPL